ncbi:hypothetical protein DXG01_008559, partial [Tephrocybe rancida]
DSNSDEYHQFQMFQAFLRSTQPPSTSHPAGYPPLPLPLHQPPSQAPPPPVTQQAGASATGSSTLTLSGPIQTLFPTSHPLPPLHSTMGSSTQPFVGFSTLATPFAGSSSSSHANQARLASAAAVLPHRAGLPPRQAQRGRGGSTSRGCSSSVVAPRLASNVPRKATANDAIPEDSPEDMRIQVHVLSPTVSSRYCLVFNIF